MDVDGLTLVLAEIVAERHRQDEKFPDQHDLPDGTGGPNSRMVADLARSQCESAGAAVTWKHILCEEYAEATAESERRKLRAELIQVAAVAVKWLQYLDRRKS
jgi:hypothetical protein